MSPTVEMIRIRTWRVAFGVALLLVLAPIAARAESIPRPEGIQQDVNFWVRVYTEVTTNEGFLHDERNLGVIYVSNPTLRGFFRLERTGQGGFLCVFTVGDISAPGARFVADSITDEGALELVRAAVGDPELDAHVEAVDKWIASVGR